MTEFVKWFSEKHKRIFDGLDSKLVLFTPYNGECPFAGSLLKQDTKEYCWWI